MQKCIRFFCIVHFLEEFPFVNLGTVQKGICDLARQNCIGLGLQWEASVFPPRQALGGRSRILSRGRVSSCLSSPSSLRQKHLQRGGHGQVLQMRSARGTFGEPGYWKGLLSSSWQLYCLWFFFGQLFLWMILVWIWTISFVLFPADQELTRFYFCHRLFFWERWTLDSFNFLVSLSRVPSEFVFGTVALR